MHGAIISRVRGQNPSPLEGEVGWGAVAARVVHAAGLSCARTRAKPLPYPSLKGRGLILNGDDEAC
jgi:hypothetical protein